MDHDPAPMTADDVIALIYGAGCDTTQLCPASGVTLADVRDELARRLSGRALRAALDVLATDVADDAARTAARRRAEAIRAMR